MTLKSYAAILTVGILVFSGANSVTDSFAVDDPEQITLCKMTDPPTANNPKQITLCDMGVLQLVAHDLFDVRRGNGTDPNAPDFENGRLDLTTLFINTTDGSSFDDEIVAKGGEVRNRENVILFTVSAALGERYLEFKASEDSEETAKEKTLMIYHQSFATAYQNTFDEPIPAKSRGQATPDGNIALRTVHDFLPGQITFDNGTTTELLSIPPNVRLSDSELMQLTSTLNGTLDAQFLNITINHPGGPMITVNLLEVDRSFQTQFDTKLNFTSMLKELEDGRYNTTDTALQGIRELISIAYPEAYEISTRKSSSTPAPMVDMTSLVRSGLVTLPQQILEMYESHDRHLMGPVITTYQFDFPLVIDGKSYMLVDNTSTMQPQQVVTGNATDIVFTVYSPVDIVHFALYFNLHGNDVDYSHSDTYIEYDRGTVQMYNLQGHIADASIVVTVEDAQQPNKKTVSITVEFEDAIGLTNMVAYMWDENRKPAFIRIIDAIEVMAPTPDAPVVNPETTIDDSVLLLQSDLGMETPSDDGSTSGTDANLNAASSEEADTLLCIRMWAGFEPESLTDASFLTMIDLDYPDVDIPGWVMTDLGVLTAKNLVTVDEFKVALVYVLDSMIV